MQLSKTAGSILAAIVIAAGLAIVATSGESIAVRFLTTIVSIDIAARLYTHSSRGG
jgi:hypothetical protein